MQGWTLVDTYFDHALSGDSWWHDGTLGVMRDALRHGFDVLLAEALDRISRDQGVAAEAIRAGLRSRDQPIQPRAKEGDADRRALADTKLKEIVSAIAAIPGSCPTACGS
jgi:hypothetical protein